MQEKFFPTDFLEQETIINIDYAKSELLIYTSKKSIYNRLVKKMGNPSRKYYTDSQISGATWTIPFEDKKKIGQALSRPTLIGNIK